MRTLGQKLKVLFIGLVTADSKFDYRTPLLAGIGRLLNINNMSTIGIVGVVELSAAEMRSL